LENIQTITTINITDAGSGVADNPDRFFKDSSLDNIHTTLNQTTNEYKFITEPDYENPQDNNKDNYYQTTFTIYDKAGNELIKNINITITNESEPLISKWNITTAGGSINIPLVSTHNVDYDISWGDGNQETNITTNNYPHTYTNAGTYTIKITRKFPGFKFNNGSQKDKIIKIEQWGDIKLKSMNRAFYGCINLVINATDSPNLLLVHSIAQTFDGATSFNANINNWDVSRITSMYKTFKNASSFNQNLSNWSLLNVTNTSAMFENASSFNRDISNWNVSNVTNMSYMFRGATAFNQNISNWNVSNVTNMRSMLQNASSFNQNLANWDISQVTNFSNFLRNVALSSANYSNTLMGWSALTLQNAINFHGGNSQYNDAGQTSRNTIITNHGWNITDAGHE